MSARIKAPGVKPGECPGALRSVGGLRRIELEDYEPGVYFLCRHGEVVYIGQSASPKQRITQHIAEGVKQFDQAFIRHCPIEELNALESAFIHTFEPLYNCTMPNGMKISPLGQEALVELMKNIALKDDTPRQAEATAPVRKHRNGSFHLPAPPATHPAGRLLRKPEVIHMTGLCNTVLYDSIKAGTFPKPRKHGRASLWVGAEVSEWIIRMAAPAALGLADRDRAQGHREPHLEHSASPHTQLPHPPERPYP